MQIHNFLCDLLVSVKLLIDTYLFSHRPGLIKHYEFNLGNRTFQLGNKPSSSYELPAIIVSINDEQINFSGRRTDLIMQNGMHNINKTPVLYNETNEVYAYVHEEQAIVPFSISINCESQLQAKEIGYHIRKILPPYKNLNIHEFTTFIEIPNTLLFDLLNYNIYKDQIYNLYTKLNYNTGNPEYCFSLTHKPLVRLDSITTSIPDSNQSTFQTQLELSYVIPFPQFITTDQKTLIETINFSFNIDNHPIVIIPFTKYYLGKEPNYKIDRTLLIQTEETYFPQSIIISKTETQATVSIKFELKDFIISNQYKYRFSKIEAGLRKSIEPDPTFFYESENRVVFIFDIETYDEYIKPESNNPLFIDFYYDLIS